MNASSMTCRRALTILIDNPSDYARGEVLGARLHASRCPHCSSAYEPEDPELAATLRVFAGPGGGVAMSLRIALLLISVTQLAFAIPWLFGSSLLPDAHVAMSHLTRDGALGLVIAALGLITVWRPRYAHATRVMGFIVLALQLVSGFVDHERRMVSGSFEIVHLPVVVIAFALWGVAAEMSRRASLQTRPTPHVLHSRSSVS